MFTRVNSGSSFSHLQRGSFQVNEPRGLRWELFYALTINFGAWLLLIRAVQYLISRNPFG